MSLLTFVLLSVDSFAFALNFDMSLGYAHRNRLHFTHGGPSSVKDVSERLSGPLSTYLTFPGLELLELYSAKIKEIAPFVSWDTECMLSFLQEGSLYRAHTANCHPSIPTPTICAALPMASGAESYDLSGVNISCETPRLCHHITLKRAVWVRGMRFPRGTCYLQPFQPATVF